MLQKINNFKNNCINKVKNIDRNQMLKVLELGFVSATAVGCNIYAFNHISPLSYFMTISSLLALIGLGSTANNFFKDQNKVNNMSKNVGDVIIKNKEKEIDKIVGDKTERSLYFLNKDIENKKPKANLIYGLISGLFIASASVLGLFFVNPIIVLPLTALFAATAIVARSSIVKKALTPNIEIKVIDKNNKVLNTYNMHDYADRREMITKNPGTNLKIV